MIELNKKESALLITVQFDDDSSLGDIDDAMRELVELVLTSGAVVKKEILVNRDKAAPGYFIGTGKAEELKQVCFEEEIGVVVFNHDLTPTQQRNLEEIIGQKVVDRTQLILDIFARHARSLEGKYQVELAQLEYLMPRLSGKGLALSGQGGGIGTSGPGEKKLETDRRQIQKRIDKLKAELNALRNHRALTRKKRRSTAVSVALVGYTNAGKSTLINALTYAGQEVRDSLFTTLDSLSKTFVLSNGQHIIISDTVGFLRRLPHDLIEAFKATLEEVAEADLLLHVLDISHPQADKHKAAVEDVLKVLNCPDKPMITVLNKIDKLGADISIDTLKHEFPGSVPVSAKDKTNLLDLIREIEKKFSYLLVQLKLKIPLSRLSLLDTIYKEGKVVNLRYTVKNAIVHCIIPAVTAEKIKSYGDISIDS